jgi:hypothetical protein
MIAITSHAHDLLALNIDNYPAEGCANTAIATLGSRHTLRHIARAGKVDVADAMLALEPD